MKEITVLVSASGAPGTAALLRGLRENGEREVRYFPNVAEAGLTSGSCHLSLPRP